MQADETLDPLESPSYMLQILTNHLCYKLAYHIPMFITSQLDLHNAKPCKLSYFSFTSQVSKYGIFLIFCCIINDRICPGIFNSFLDLHNFHFRSFTRKNIHLPLPQQHNLHNFLCKWSWLRVDAQGNCYVTEFQEQQPEYCFIYIPVWILSMSQNWTIKLFTPWNIFL